MIADPTAQARLLDLTRIDTQLTQLQHKLKNLPEQAQLVDLGRQRRAVSESVVAHDAQLSDADIDQAKVEADLEQARARMTRNRQRMEQGVFSDAREYKGLSDEIQHLEYRISELEDAALELMEKIEGLQAERARLAADQEQIETQMKTLLVSRDSQAATINQTVSERTKERADIVSRLPPDLVSLYEKIGARTGGTGGAATLQNRRCTGCGLELDATEYKRIMNAAPDEVIRCEECGRILVREV